MPKKKSTELTVQDNLQVVNDGKLEKARHIAIVRASDHIVKVVDAIAGKAETGDVQAARLLFEVCGMIRRPGVAVAIQNNTTSQPKTENVPTLMDILGPEYFKENN